jgi:YVTN family beta-propeller protein
MAKRHTLLVVAVAILMPLSLVAAVATPASAKVITPSGKVGCAVGGSLAFNPPLTPGNGTPNVASEVISTTLALSSCAGSSQPVNHVPTASTSVVTKAIKIKAIKIGRTKYAGGCSTFASAIKASSINSTITWNNGIKVSSTTLGNPVLHTGNTEDNLNALGSATKSFAGSGSLNAFLDSASTRALGICLTGRGSSISSVTFDASTSSITLGPVSVYVPSEEDQTVTPINTETNTAGTPITGVVFPWDIAIAPNGKSAYTTDLVGTSVTPINLVTGTAGTPINVGTGGLGGVAITPNGATAYVVNNTNSTVTPINTATNTAGTPIAVGSHPVSIAIAPNGVIAYVVSNGSGTVTPINTATNTAGPQIPAGSNAYAIAITPDGSTAYVDDLGSSVTPINLATDQDEPAISVSTTTSFSDIAITPNGASAYVTNNTTDAVTPINLATQTLGAPIVVPDQPLGIAITPNGATAYVACASESGGSVTPINLATDKVETPIAAVGQGPFYLAVG